MHLQLLIYRLEKVAVGVGRDFRFRFIAKAFAVLVFVARAFPALRAFFRPIEPEVRFDFVGHKFFIF
jgi:hypothetical protein